MKLGARRPAGGLIHRAIFSKAVPRAAVGGVRRSSHPDAARLASAIDAIRGEGIDADESNWIERIELYRDEFAERTSTIAAALPTSPGHRDRTPRQVAQVASIQRPWGTFLQRLVRELQPRSCVELGTSIGISAAYQGSGLELNGEGRLFTVEGSPQLAALARETLDVLRISRVEVHDGTFDQVLGDVLTKATPIDFAYIDAGKGREENLLQFERLLPHLAPGAALVMDDVHWSREMHDAWRQISGHERVGVSVDLRCMGACLLNPD